MEPNETDASAPAEAAAPAPVSRLPLVAMGALVALAILVAIGLGLRGNRSFPAGSPEDALQQFLEAGLDGDEDATVALMVPEARDDCTDRLEPQYGPRSTRGLGFELDDVDVDGPVANISVTMRYSDNGDPFDGSSRGGTYRFELHQQGDEWFVADADWPWWIQRCLPVR